VHIDWPILAAVAVVAAGIAITVVLLVAFAFVSLSLRPHGQVGRLSGWDSVTRPTVGTVIAGFCLLTAGLIVCYGLYLIVT
jgi:hypothetical protein